MERAPAVVQTGRRAELQEYWRLVQKNLRAGLNHAALMVAYRHGPAARTAYFARTRDRLPEPESRFELLPAAMASVAEQVHDSLVEVAGFDGFGPVRDAPTRPGPGTTAQYARAHLEGLARSLPRTTAVALTSSPVERWLRERASVGFGVGIGLA
jgi:hypothetical protein